MRFTSIVALAASLSTSAAVYQGFNYGSTKADGSFNEYSDFKSLFTDAQNLVGTSGFSSARIYTMIQGGSSTNEPTQAIQAAIDTGTTLLLGLWASGGDGPFNAELIALTAAIDAHGDKFAKLVAGISVGSEDLYRSSATGQAANAGIGASAATVASYISLLRANITGTVLADVPVGHVDTWTAWTEGGVDSVIDACDFIGLDAYPYFQNTMANSITDGKSLFNAAMAATQSAVGSKPVWITETGWPVSGKTENLGVPGLAAAKTYWDEVGCPNFGTVNTWWFTLQDSNGATPNPSFGLIGSSYTTTPLYDLSCSDVSSSSSASSQSSTEASSSSSTAVSGGSGGLKSSASATSSIASAASSLSSAATGGSAASSGSGLSPSEGAGNGIGSSATATGSTSSATGVSGGNSTVPVGTKSSGLQTSATASASSSSVSTVSTNAASVLSGSFAGAMGALFIAVAAL